jgi:predicted kinase
MREFIILSGLPASGKSTRAKRWLAEDPANRERMNYDDLRLYMFGKDWKFNYPDESKMKAKAQELVMGWMLRGKSIVIDNTNLTRGVRQQWRDLAERYNMGGNDLNDDVCPINIVEEELDTDLLTCVQRDAERARNGERSVGRAVIERMALFNGFVDWDTFQDNIVVVDLDGTVADHTHRLGHIQKQPKDWDSFFKECTDDPPIKGIVELVKHLAEHDHDIIVVTGRSMVCCKETEEWLERHNIPCDMLLMRQTHDKREDTVVKGEIADLLPLHKVKYVLEDRPRIIKMWQAKGFTTLAVGKLEEF